MNSKWILDLIRKLKKVTKIEVSIEESVNDLREILDSIQYKLNKTTL